MLIVSHWHWVDLLVLRFDWWAAVTNKTAGTSAFPWHKCRNKWASPSQILTQQPLLVQQLLWPPLQCRSLWWWTACKVQGSVFKYSIVIGRCPNLWLWKCSCDLQVILQHCHEKGFNGIGDERRSQDSDSNAKITNFTLRKLPAYSGGTCWLVLEWLWIGGSQCLDCGDAPFGEVTTAERNGEWGHANSATAPDVAGPGNDNFNIWKLNPSFGWIWNASIDRTVDGRHCRRGRSWTRQGHWFRIWSIAVWISWQSVSPAVFSFHGEADVTAAVGGSLLPYLFCAIMH